MKCFHTYRVHTQRAGLRRERLLRAFRLKEATMKKLIASAFIDETLNWLMGRSSGRRRSQTSSTKPDAALFE
jgi:hypothetical protein